MTRKWTDEYVRGRFPALVAEKLRAEGKNPRVKPTHAWLREHGFMGIQGYANRNEMTVDEVLLEKCGFEPRPNRPLPGSHAETRNKVNQWLTDEEEAFGRLSDTTNARTHIVRTMEMAREEFGSVDLFRFGRQSSDVAVRDALDLFKRMNRELESEGARYNYASTLVEFLDYLELLGEIDGHPVDDVLARMDWSYSRSNDQLNLTPDQVSRCWEAAEDPEEHLLVVLLGFAGIRPNDVTLIYSDDVILDDVDPRIQFGEERKNGRGSAAILAGVDVIDDYLSYLADEWSDWNGALFPSEQSADGTRSVAWVRNRVDEIVSRAGVTLDDGSVPTPKHFRRFWFTAYTEAVSEFLDLVDDIADEQGSNDPKIVSDHYLPDQQRRDHLRQYARNHFEAATPGDELVRPEDLFEAREQEPDPQLDLTDFDGADQQ